MAKISLVGIALAARALAIAASVSPASAERSSESLSDEPPTNQPGLISFPITPRQHTPPGGIRRRDNDVPLYNVSSISYLIELAIGTPGQKVRVAIDTGSDELWVNPDCTSAGSQDQINECLQNGKYEPSKSSTSTRTSIKNFIPYGKGQVNMTYVLDSISLPDSTISLKQVQFGVATATKELNEGILGLSFGQNVNLDYPNLIDGLFLQNQTNSRAFSIALGSKDFSNSGSLVFGGVDRKKFFGKLQGVPLLGRQGGERFSRYWVSLNGVKFNSQSSSSQQYDIGGQVPVVLDSGSTLSYLPDNLITQIARSLGASFNSRYQFYVVSCDTAASKDTLDFTFANNATIRVPMFEFIWEVGQNTCVLGAMGIGRGGIALLGDSMMRAGYFVFDQDNKSIFMAQYANCGEDEQIIPKGGKASDFTGSCTQQDVDKLLQSGRAPSGHGNTGGKKGAGSSVRSNMAVVVSLVTAVGFAVALL